MMKTGPKGGSTKVIECARNPTDEGSKVSVMLHGNVLLGRDFNQSDEDGNHSASDFMEMGCKEW